MIKRKKGGTATKRDPKKWAAAKARAKRKMGGKHSARAMQLAVKYYKDSGGSYSGKKKSTNKLSKWSKAKMENKVRQTIWQNGRKIFTGESNQIPVVKGICSDHQSKEKRDCCREAVREAAQKDSS